MSVIEDLVPLFKKLKLSGVLHTLELRLGEAAEDELAYQEFLYHLFKDEVERRETALLAAAKQRGLRQYVGRHDSYRPAGPPRSPSCAARSA